MKGVSGSKSSRPTAIMLIICAVTAVAVFVLFPNLLSYDLGAANAQYRHELSADNMTPELADNVYDLPVLFAVVENRNLLFPDWYWTPDNSTGILPPRVNAASEIYVFDDGENTLLDNPSQYLGNAMLRLRGRTSSYAQNKRPFKLEIYDESGKSFNQPLLSLPAESDFVLSAPFIDRSLIRNWLAYTLGGEILEYSPRCQFVEVFLNQEGSEYSERDYVGVYLLTESIKPSVERVPVGDYTYPIVPSRWFEEGGGYIAVQDHYEPGFDDAHLLMPTPNGEEFLIHSPKYGALTYGDADAIKAELDFFEDIIINGTDEQLDYYIDIDSYVDILLLNEFLRNYERLKGSAFYYRAKGGKFTCGPPWDFDLSMGNKDYDPDYGYINAEGFETLNTEKFAPLLAHPIVRERLVERWRELRAKGGAFSEEHIDRLIDSANEQLINAAPRSDAAYPELFDERYKLYGNSLEYHPANSLEEREMIREFLRIRGRWLDENINTIAD